MANVLTKHIYRQKPFLRKLGITRVARITGLDRAGVEVACAIRPRGHILQVTNGKGLTFEEAADKAVMEAAELWASESVSPPSLRYGAWPDFEPEGLLAWPAEALGQPNELNGSRAWMAFCEATEVFSKASVWVPAHVVYCLPEGSVPLGLSVLPWTSNGMGAHVTYEKALTHALLEAIERDQLARVLPEGFTSEAVRQRLIHPESLKSCPDVAALRKTLRERGFEVHLFDFTYEKGFGVPVAGALLVDLEEGPIPLTAGYACAFDKDQALVSALLEAAQSRLTDVHGAREDAVDKSTTHLRPLLNWLKTSSPSRQASQMPSLRETKNALKVLLNRLREKGFSEVAVVNLTKREKEFQVVKVLIPGFLRSELL